MDSNMQGAHVKILARLLVERLANPERCPDMNDGSIDWQSVYDAMRLAQTEEDHMGSVLTAGLVALSGYDPWGDPQTTKAGQ